MSRSVLELDSVSKRYRLGEHLGGLTDFRESVMARLRPGRTTDVNELWALRDVSLSLGKGQSLGVVGRNGAGKSTFLKVVAGVTTPTSGVCRTRGRIGSLLEVGTGFHPELTGQENAFLSGAIMGMSRAEVASQLDEIVDFAGLEGFMDTPVKRYSSGMYLRLAFAVAAHLQADILLVDEVLAVGDAEFRRKCLAKMSAVEAEGRTVIFASHNLDALTQFCKDAVWFDGGQIAAHGPAGAVVRQYLNSTASNATTTEIDVDEDSPASALSVAVLDSAMDAQNVVTAGDDVTVEVEVLVRDATPEVDVGIVVQRANGTVLFDENLIDPQPGIGTTGRHRVRLHLGTVLTPGEYSLGVWIGTAYDDYEFHENVAAFSVAGDDADRSDRLVDLGAPWSTTRID